MNADDTVSEEDEGEDEFEWSTEGLIGQMLQAKGTRGAREYLSYLLEIDGDESGPEFDAVFRRLIALDGTALTRDELCYALHYLITNFSLDFQRAERTSERYRELTAIFTGIVQRRAALGIRDYPRSSAIPDEEIVLELEMDWIAIDTIADWFCELGLDDMGDELRRDPRAFDKRLIAGERGLTGAVRRDAQWARWSRLPECGWKRTFTPRSGRAGEPAE